MNSASAIILAGGQSLRMGRPKAALMFGNCTLLERLIAELLGDFNDILIVAAPAQSEAFPIEELLRAAPPSVRLLRDCNSHEGPAVALARGLAAAANDVSFACSCDVPLLRVAVVRALHEMLNDVEGVIPIIGGTPQPLFAFYRRDAAEKIEMRLASGERRLTSITAGLRAYRPEERELRQFDPDLRSFLNINTPEDYHRACAILRLLNVKPL